MTRTEKTAATLNLLLSTLFFFVLIVPVIITAKSEDLAALPMFFFAIIIVMFTGVLYSKLDNIILDILERQKGKYKSKVLHYCEQLKRFLEKGKHNNGFTNICIASTIICPFAYIIGAIELYCVALIVTLIAYYLLDKHIDNITGRDNKLYKFFLSPKGIAIMTKLIIENLNKKIQDFSSATYKALSFCVKSLFFSCITIGVKRNRNMVAKELQKDSEQQQTRQDVLRNLIEKENNSIENKLTKAVKRVNQAINTVQQVYIKYSSPNKLEQKRIQIRKNAYIGNKKRNFVNDMDIVYAIMYKAGNEKALKEIQENKLTFADIEEIKERKLEQELNNSHNMYCNDTYAMMCDI